MSQVDPGVASMHDDAARASGANIFWCLMALAFSCMVQPSFIGCVWGKGTFKDTIWPQRSSPLFCLLDSVVDIFGSKKLFYPRAYAGDNDQNDSPDTSSEGTIDGEEMKQAESIAITMRLAIFLLSVVPQAIQIFSMRGIPLTQLIAAAFCLSATTNTFCDLRRASLQTTKTFDSGKRLRDLPYLSTTRWQPLGRFNTLMLLPIFAHVALLLCACRLILDRGRPLDIRPDSPWMTFVEIPDMSMEFVYILSFVQAGYVITDKLPEIIFVCLAAGPFSSLTISILNVNSQEKHPSNYLNASRILIWLCMTCLFMSWLPKACARRFACGREVQSNRLADRDLEASHAIATATNRRQSIDVTETIFEPEELAIINSTGDDSTSQASTGREQSNLAEAGLPDPADYGVRSEDTLPLSSDASGQYDAQSNGGQTRALDMPALLLSKAWSAMGSMILWIYQETDPQAFKRYPKWRRPMSYTALLILRYFRATFELQLHGLRAIGILLSARSGDEIWMAFGLLNVVTAAIYYLFLFDDAGTSVPNWSSLFG